MNARRRTDAEMEPESRDPLAFVWHWAPKRGDGPALCGYRVGLRRMHRERRGDRSMAMCPLCQLAYEALPEG